MTETTGGLGSEAHELHPGRLGLVQIHPASASAPPRVFALAGSAVAGRSHRLELQLDDARVSRRHASLEPAAGGVRVRDLGSRHGTFVSAKRVPAEGMLAPLGSVLRVGDSLLLVVKDVESFRSRPRRTDGSQLGLTETMVAGPELAAVWDEAARVASLPEPVLIVGETGSGKECVARMIHAARPEPGPFVGINVAAVPDSLAEAELFGYERGAFTGATVGRPGAFRCAEGGVLFLDEIGELPPALQPKLLRALDRGEVRPLGGHNEVRVSARIVSATSRSLANEQGDAGLRPDLYYRLAGVIIRVPPLRERPADALWLALELLSTWSPATRLSADAAERLVLSPWKGNARELRHRLTQALVRAGSTGVLRVEH
ncbi:MAG TPA: sigma 54-interacting transcriptional regulator, partial [Polyangiaceae bacterium]|nr:sigma 54-interacting transcriptional regulator [Polyangiaceae bacterium]